MNVTPLTLLGGVSRERRAEIQEMASWSACFRALVAIVVSDWKFPGPCIAERIPGSAHTNTLLHTILVNRLNLLSRESSGQFSMWLVTVLRITLALWLYILTSGNEIDYLISIHSLRLHSGAFYFPLSIPAGTILPSLLNIYIFENPFKMGLIDLFTISLDLTNI